MSWITIDEARANLKMWLDAERLPLASLTKSERVA